MPSANKAARAARKAEMIPRAAAEDTDAGADAAPGEAAPASADTAGEESGFWKKLFLNDGHEEVSSAESQKFQAELKANKAAAKAEAGDQAACTIM